MNLGERRGIDEVWNTWWLDLDLDLPYLKLNPCPHSKPFGDMTMCLCLR